MPVSICEKLLILLYVLGLDPLSGRVFDVPNKQKESQGMEKTFYPCRTLIDNLEDESFHPQLSSKAWGQSGGSKTECLIFLGFPAIKTNQAIAKDSKELQKGLKSLFKKPILLTLLSRRCRRANLSKRNGTIGTVDPTCSFATWMLGLSLVFTAYFFAAVFFWGSLG